MPALWQEVRPAEYAATLDEINPKENKMNLRLNLVSGDNVHEMECAVDDKLTMLETRVVAHNLVDNMFSELMFAPYYQAFDAKYPDYNLSMSYNQAIKMTELSVRDKDGNTVEGGITDTIRLDHRSFDTQVELMIESLKDVENDEIR